MKRDSNKDPSKHPQALLAKILIDQVDLSKFLTVVFCFYFSNWLKFGTLQVDRKLVKQTVMTSVYGVTFVGAREQIKRRLEEKGHITDDRQLFAAACYAAKVSN